MSLFRLSLARIACSMLPPLLTQKVRNKVYPLELGIRQNQIFEKKSVTGSPLSGFSGDYHFYRFMVHGFFEWRNVVIANFFARNKSGDIIEAGANVGTETVSFCDILNTRGNVHAFEPLPQNIVFLESVERMQTNLKLHRVAVSDTESTARFAVPSAVASGQGKIINPEFSFDGATIDVPTLPLDHFLPQFNKVLLLCIDTEGHEPFVLRGATALMDTHRPPVVIEASPKLLKKYADSSFTDVHDFFTTRDYVCYKIGKFGLEDVAPEDHSSTKATNLLCLPSERRHEAKPLSRELFTRFVVPWYFLPKISAKKAA